MNSIPNFSDIERAFDRIGNHIHHTPVLTSSTINKLFSASVFFKCENLQRVGAFKFRGASNAILSLNDEMAHHGVATHSSGNHAQAIALAATERGIPSYIVMPHTAPAVKKAAVAGYGGTITYCEPNLKAREEALAAVVVKTGAHFIHPYENSLVIAGQGTAAFELLREIPDLDCLITPVGGGGLLSGSALAAKGLSKTIKVIGAEPVNADDAHRSLRDGQRYPPLAANSIADGLLSSLGKTTFSLIQQNVDAIHTATEESIKRALRLIFERMKIVVEPSAAVPLAMLLDGKLNIAHKKVGIILTGGNIELDRLQEFLV